MILIFGASYGILASFKFLLAGYDVVCICKKDEAKYLNKNGFLINIPGYLKTKLNIESKNLKGRFFPTEPNNIDLSKIKIVILAMQEDQYKDVKLSSILLEIAQKKIPTISIMNIPPSVYLKNFNLNNIDELDYIYVNNHIWKKFDENFITHSSADPQIYKPNIEKINEIHVRLASNFKISDFKDNKSSKLLEIISNKINNARYLIKEKNTKIPINFNIFKSNFVSISKWPMIITGNYRCLENNKLRSIKEAVNEDLNYSKKIYNDVYELCKKIGAEDKDLINFEKYVKASQNLNAPSSVSRQAYAGGKNFERVDKLVLFFAKKNNIQITGLDEIISNFNQI